MLFAPLVHVHNGFTSPDRAGAAVVPKLNPTMLMFPGVKTGIAVNVPPVVVGVTPVKLVNPVAVFTSPVLVVNAPVSEMPPVSVTAFAADAARRHPRRMTEELSLEIIIFEIWFP